MKEVWFGFSWNHSRIASVALAASLVEGCWLNSALCSSVFARREMALTSFVDQNLWNQRSSKMRGKSSWHKRQFSNLENFKHRSLYAKFDGYIECVLAWDLSYRFRRKQLFFAQKPGIMTVCSYALTLLNLGAIPIWNDDHRSTHSKLGIIHETDCRSITSMKPPTWKFTGQHIHTAT
jgi:hypothetical protein